MLCKKCILLSVCCVSLIIKYSCLFASKPFSYVWLPTELDLLFSSSCPFTFTVLYTSLEVLAVYFFLSYVEADCTRILNKEVALNSIISFSCFKYIKRLSFLSFFLETSKHRIQISWKLKRFVEQTRTYS